MKQYIESQREKVVTDEAIRQSLIGVGWPETAFNETLPAPVALTAVIVPPPLAASTPPKITEVPPTVAVPQPLVERAEDLEPIQPQPKRTKWLKIGLAIVAGLALLLVVGWLVLPLMKPERVVVAALQNLINSDVTKYELAAEFLATPNSEEGEAVLSSDYKFTIEASADKSKPSKGRVFVNIAQLGEDVKSPNGDLGSLELRWLENILYLRLDSKAEEITMFNLQEFVGKWFSIDVTKTLDDLGANEQYNLELTPDNIRQLTDAYEKNAFLNVEASLGTQTIAGQTAKGFQISYDREKLANWLAESEKITDQPNPLGREEILNSLPDPTEIGTMKIWVSKKTTLPIRFEYEQKATTEEPGILSKVTLLSIGQPIVVEKPSPVMPLDEMIKQLQGDFSDSTEQATGPRKWLFSAYGSKDN